MARAHLLTPLISLLVLASLTLEAPAYVRSVTEAGDEVHWFTRCIPIWLNQTGSSRIPMAEVERDLSNSLQAWDRVSCAELAFSYEGLTTSAEIGFDPTPNADNQNIVAFQSGQGSWIHDPRAVGLTTVTMCQNDTPSCAAGTILDADIELNEVGFELTSSSARAVKMDLANTLTHEVGHLLGLDHSEREEATMYAEAPLGETEKRTLSTDDEAGICEIFPRDSALYCVLTPYDLMAGPPTGSTSGAEEIFNDPSEEGCAQDGRSRASLISLILSALLCLSLLFYRAGAVRRGAHV